MTDQLSNDTLRSLYRQAVMASPILTSHYGVLELTDRLKVIEPPLWFVGIAQRIYEMGRESAQNTPAPPPGGQTIPFHREQDMTAFLGVYMACLEPVAMVMKDENYIEGPVDEQDIRRRAMRMADAVWRDSARYLVDGWWRGQFDVDAFFGMNTDPVLLTEGEAQ